MLGELGFSMSGGENKDPPRTYDRVQNAPKRLTAVYTQHLSFVLFEPRKTMFVGLVEV